MSCPTPVPGYPPGASGPFGFPAQPPMQPISGGRIAWWSVLGLLVGLSLLLTIGAIGVTLRPGGFGSTGDNIGANLFFDTPLVVFGFLAYRERRNFRRARAGHR